ncbi:hypothetical protein GQ54DRAFT_23666 [Martensiomyces pterosporus]|nr:hypothetical protein GQ54DRAFT_23666 [Martensiomyces pterosporus]
MDYACGPEAVEKQKERTELWSAKLLGKKFVESEVAPASDSEFSLASIPKNHRILRGENAVMTLDYRPERINIRLDSQGICTEVFFV